MNPRLATFALLILAPLPARAQSDRDAGWTEDLAASRIEVGVGITWMHAHYDVLRGRPQSISVLEVDPRAGDARVDVIRADGRERTSALAREAGALAAVNGGFFAPDGAPVGYLKLDGELVRLPEQEPEHGIGVDSKGRMHIAVMPKNAWKKVHEALGAGPRLVEHGRVVDHGPDQRKIRHPRTAVGTREDGALVFLVADGRTEMAGGLSLEELGSLFVDLGCEDAVNLDGGGSSVMWIRGRGEGGVVSFPCDNKLYDHAGERAVGNSVLIHAPAVVVLDDDDAELDAELAARDDRDRCFGSDFAWTEDGGDVAATWRVTLPYAGRWRIEAWWPRLRGREAGRATLRAGEVELACDQRKRGGKWTRLGELEVETVELSVELRGRDGEPLTVDALRLVQLP